MNSEKQAVRFQPTYRTWSCGDGCCSDSEFGGRVLNLFNDEVIDEYEPDKDVSSAYCMLEQVRREYDVKEVLNEETLYYDDDDDDDDDDDVV